MCKGKMCLTLVYFVFTSTIEISQLIYQVSDRITRYMTPRVFSMGILGRISNGNKKAVRFCVGGRIPDSFCLMISENFFQQMELLLPNINQINGSYFYFISFKKISPKCQSKNLHSARWKKKRFSNPTYTLSLAMRR